MNQIPEAQKSIYEYDNYRLFLRDYYLRAKAKDKKFSFRYFARLAGLKSFSFLNLIMKGRSNISTETAHNLCRAMKLNLEESHFFLNLVLFNQAKSSEEKQRHAKSLMRSRGFKKIRPLGLSQYDYFAKWYYVVVRGLVGLKNFNEDPNWIAKSVIPNITKEEAIKALIELEKLGLIQRDKSGRLVQTNSNVSTPDEVTLCSIAKYHREMMARASESIDSIPREHRDLSTITVGLSPEMLKRVKEMVQAFRKEIVEVVSHDENSSLIYQINFHLFPVAEVQRKETP